MEGIRQSITAHNAAIAAHLQAQQHQAHAQAQHQAAAVAVAQQQRNNSFVWHQQAAAANNTAAAQMQNGYSNFMPSMLAMQSNMNSMAMVATAKVAPFRKNASSKSSLAVRTTVPRLNVAGGIYTVAQWARKCVEDNIEFVVKLARSSDAKADLVMLCYGDGCHTLVFFDDAMNKLPADLAKVKKIHVGVSTAQIDDKRTGAEMAESGVLQPSDSLWDHLRYEQANPAKDKKEKIMFIHTSMKVYGDSDVSRRRVLQIKTNAPKSPLVAKSYVRNVMFERQILAKWKGDIPGVTPVLPEYPMGAAGVTPIVPAPNPTAEKEANEYLITFNPKELLLLEKAFDNGLTPRDLKSKAEKWTDEDQKKCQLTILRAQNEFKYVFPRKPNRKKGEKDAEAKAKKSDDATASTKKATPAKKPTTQAKATKESPKKAKRSSIGKKKDKTPAPKKSAAKAKAEPVDSDDEPIVKMKTPAKKATPAKAKSKTTAPKKTPAKPAPKKTPAKPAPKKTPAKKATTQAKAKVVKKAAPPKSASKKRGRDSSVAPPAKKTRSSSKPRSTRSKK